MKALILDRINDETNTCRGVVLAKSSETTSLSVNLTIDGVQHHMTDGSMILEVDTGKKIVLYEEQWYYI